VKVKIAEKTATDSTSRIAEHQEFHHQRAGRFWALQVRRRRIRRRQEEQHDEDRAAQMQNAIAQAETNIVRDIQQQDACVALLGCFRGSVKLETRDGWKRVDEITPADFVRSRDEFDSEGELAWKRWRHLRADRRILELVANGKEIATRRSTRSTKERAAGSKLARCISAMKCGRKTVGSRSTTCETRACTKRSIMSASPISTRTSWGCGLAFASGA